MDQDLAQEDTTEVLKHKPIKDNKRPLTIYGKIILWFSRRSYGEVSLTYNIDKKKKSLTSKDESSAIAPALHASTPSKQMGGHNVHLNAA